MIPRIELRLKLWAFKQSFRVKFNEVQNSYTVAETCLNVGGVAFPSMLTIVCW